MAKLGKPSIIKGWEAHGKVIPSQNSKIMDSQDVRAVSWWTSTLNFTNEENALPKVL